MGSARLMTHADDYNPIIYEQINISAYIFWNANALGKKFHNFNTNYGQPVYYDWPGDCITDGRIIFSELKTSISGVL